MTNSWNVDLVERTHGRTCWAACVAMLLNHRDSSSLTDGDVASEAGVEHDGSVATDSDGDSILDHYILTAFSHYAPSPREWEQLLAPGPAIAGLMDRVVVVGAVNGEDDPADCQLYVLDPAYGEAWYRFNDLGPELGFHPGVELRIVQP